MYRTPEQDERLSKLYIERERVCDYAARNNVDVSLALKAIDDEIEFLTDGIGEMKSEETAVQDKEIAALDILVAYVPPEPLVDDPERVAEAVEMAFDHDPRTPDEKALDEWQAEAKATEFNTREWFNSLPEIEF